jgi:hypothetical protein
MGLMLRRIVFVVAIACTSLGVSVTGASAESCSNEQLRVENNSTALPDCRAYELVSPGAPAAGVKFDPFSSASFGLTEISPDGNRALFTSFSGFAGAPGAIYNGYQSERDPSGVWRPTSITPGLGEYATVASNAAPFDASDDLSTTILFTTAALDPLDTEPPASAGEEYYDLYDRTPDGAIHWISRDNSGSPQGEVVAPSYVGRSADASHIVFHTTAHLVAPAVGPSQMGGGNLYDRTDGHTYLVGINDSGALTSQCGAGTPLVYPSVASYGSAVAFVSPDPSGEGAYDPSCSEPSRIYVRIDNQMTIDVSQSQRTVPDPGSPAGASFEGITRDGQHVFFTSTDRLTNEATVGGGLYEFDISSRTLREVVADSEAKIQFRSVYASKQNEFGLLASNDGSRVYLTSRKQLTPDAPAGEGDYLLDGGSIKYVGPPAGSSGRGPMASEDGSTLAFVSSEQLTSYDNEGYAEVYVYHADAAGVICVSCRADGRPPTGNASLETAVPPGPPSNVSADGERVFFQSPDPLTSGDSNDALDVYEYEDGEQHLISSGRAPTESYFAGASASGDDVLFSTASSLTSADANTSVDLYDARVDGGSAGVGSVTGGCSGDACQGEPTLSPGVVSVGTVTLTESRPVAGPAGSGSSESKSLLGVKVSKMKTITGSTGVLTVRVSSGGSLVTSGSGLKATNRKVDRAGTYTVKVTLTAKGRRTLLRKSPYRTKMKIIFRPSRGTSSTAGITLTFKVASMKKGR